MARTPDYPRLLTVASAFPPYNNAQETMLKYVLDYTLGADWRAHEERAADARLIERLFTSSGVRQRQSAVDLPAYYAAIPGTAARMLTYAPAAYALGHDALEKAAGQLDQRRVFASIQDFVVVSCTGYTAPGLDIQLARDLSMPRDVRRVIIGHMGCFGALVGLRQSLAAVRVHPETTAALLCVELATLHFAPSLNPEVLTSCALFGDAAAATFLSFDDNASGPELIDTYCAADFATADQMSWNITDQGFVMSLSPRVPITLRRNILGVMDKLLTPHGLTRSDVRHWIIHPGGPSILDAIQGRLELSDEQMALSWQILGEHGNCSSATVLLILEALLQSGKTQTGEWGVMMAFGPGLTLETCLLRF